MIKLAKTLPNRDLEILMSIPGIAEITAVRILAELGDIRRFSNPNKINDFFGIDPGRYQSGEKDSSLRISKHGNAVARKILYRAIGQIDLAAKTSPCHIADYYELLAFLSFPPAIRPTIYSTNILESLNKRIKRKTKPKEQFPNEKSLDNFIGVQVISYNEKYFNRSHRGFGQVKDTLESFFE